MSGRILIVDDEPALRRVLERILVRAGYSCTAAANAADARACLEADRFDVVLTDITMPGESGLSLAAHVHERWPETAVLVVSGVGEADVAKSALDSGAVGYVLKPFEANQVVISVAGALKRIDDDTRVRGQRERLEETVAQRTAELELTRDELEEVHERLKQSEERFRSLAQQSPVAILFADVEGECQYSNPMASELSGYSADELHGAGWFRVVHADELDFVLRQLQIANERRSNVQFEHRVMRRDGGERWASTSVGPIANEHGEPTGFVAVVEDVTERREYQAMLVHNATHDPATQLPNRTLVADRLAVALRDADAEHRVVVVHAVIDRFHAIRDSLGHAAADELVAVVVDQLRDQLDERDTLGRMGDNAFVVVREQVGSDRVAGTLVESLVANARGTIAIGGTTVYVTLSAGLAICMGSRTAETLLRDAAIAARWAEERGGDGYEFGDDQLGNRVAGRLALESALREAIHDGKLLVHYQPEFHADGRLYGVEALVRWERDGLLVGPDQFIPVAEESGLIVDLGEWVLEAACRQAQQWRTGHRDLSTLVMSVNASARQLADSRLVVAVERALARTGLPPRALCLEVTESAVMADPQAAARDLARLKEMGVQLALDDFGTGYSSLAQVNQLPLDVVKIDRSFVMRLTDDVRAVRVVEAIIRLAQALDLRVVAEGVETQGQRQVLTELGCDLLQGYLLGRPAPSTTLRLLPEDTRHAFIEGAVLPDRTNAHADPR